VVFHCAGFAHADDDGSEQFAAQHWAVNYQGVVNVGEAAQHAGVKRLVFISTAKAVADAPQTIIDETFAAQPSSPYGKAKRAAEEALLALAKNTDLEIVILRPVMVYGRNGSGNLPRIMQGIRRGWFPPLPQGGARSLIHIDDLVSALLLAGTHPAAAGQTYFVAHPEPQTTRQLCHIMRQSLGKSIPLWAVPAALLKLIAIAGDFVSVMIGKPAPFNRAVYDKLMQSAIYSADKISAQLGWKACVDLSQGLGSMIARDPSPDGSG
jgi:nucleoside-diphosphate-sugar epimerase